MKNVVLTLGICMLAAAYGCTSSSSSKSPATVVVPNVGTSWTFQNIYRDSNNNVTKTDTSTRVVVGTNMTIQGFSDVVMTVETFTSSKVSDTVYIRYLSTGNISRLSWPLVAPHIAPEWLTIPYYSQKSYPYAWSGGVGYRGYTHDTIAFSSSNTGQANDTVAGVVYAASVIASSTWEEYTGPGKDSLDVTNQTNSFIASAGIFGNRQATLRTINGKQAVREQQVLIAVNLK